MVTRDFRNGVVFTNSDADNSFDLVQFGANVDYTLTAAGYAHNANLQGLTDIRLHGATDSVLTISSSTVKAIANNNAQHKLLIQGNAGDTVNLGNEINSGRVDFAIRDTDNDDTVDTEEMGGKTYAIYDASLGGEAIGSVLVEQDVSVSFLYNFYNTDDGVFRYEFDTNLDGTIDTIEYDDDKDGLAERIDTDTNANGTIDTITYDTNHDGTSDRIEMDTDADGIMDTTSYFQHFIGDQAVLTDTDGGTNGNFDILQVLPDGDFTLESSYTLAPGIDKGVISLDEIYLSDSSSKVTLTGNIFKAISNGQAGFIVRVQGFERNRAELQLINQENDSSTNDDDIRFSSGRAREFLGVDYRQFNVTEGGNQIGFVYVEEGAVEVLPIQSM